MKEQDRLALFLVVLVLFVTIFVPAAFPKSRLGKWVIEHNLTIVRPVPEPLRYD